MINIEDIVVNTSSINDVVPNSVGIIKAIDSKNATVLFVGLNKILRVGLEHLQAVNPKETGKGYDNKICNICHILKETDQFDVNQTDAKRRKTTRPSCRVCRQTIDGVQLKPEEKNRIDKIKPPEGSVFECPICQKRTIVGVTANLVRDHDHKTGQGREWICDSCNTGLGCFKDDIRFLYRVIAYLQRHK